MPRLVNKIPKYRRHASGQAVVTLDGRDFYLGQHGKAGSRREYDRLTAEWKANNRSLPAKIIGDDYTVAELIHAYLKHCEVYYAGTDGKSSGDLRSIRLMLRVTNKLYADTPVRDFGPLALRAVRNAMVGEDWSRKYTNAQIGWLRRMFKWGVGRELVPADVWHALQAVEPLSAGKSNARETADVKTIDDAYVDAVLPWLNRHVAAMVELQRATGMRPGELIIIRGMDINTKNPKLWEYRPAKHKTTHRGHDRVVYINTDAQEIIRPFLKTDVTAYLFDPRDAEAERREAKSRARKTPLSCGNRPGTNKARKPRRAPGPRYGVDSFYRAITRACDLANSWAKAGQIIANDVRAIPRWHPHQIRHNTATKLRAAHGLEAAQVILGHKTLTATQIYAEKNIEKAKRIMTGGN